ncbi:COMM domain-containing protein 5 [Panulirus ornatus]|uniref:COMM domain-containing protein 5 n=1 Tax=Panulirus ornatus TaxID=150431 RepID=UPI003A851FF3
MASGSAEDSVIFTTRCPDEVKVLIKASHSMDKVFFRRLIKLGLAYLQGTLGEDECETAIKHLYDNSQPVTHDSLLNICFQYAGVVSLLQAALRVNTITTRQDIFAADLANIGLPHTFASDVGRVIFGPARADIDSWISATPPTLPIITDLNWRVEVTISTSWVSRVLEPVVLLRLEMSDRSSHTFQVPLSKFHQLRFTVASLLQQINSLKTSHICKK